jgi:hypothetical protein
MVIDTFLVSGALATLAPAAGSAGLAGAAGAAGGATGAGAGGAAGGAFLATQSGCSTLVNTCAQAPELSRTGLPLLSSKFGVTPANALVALIKDAAATALTMRTIFISNSQEIINFYSKLQHCASSTVDAF